MEHRKTARFFKYVLFKPVDYLANTETWIFSVLSEVWLFELDYGMKIPKRKVILFLNNLTSYEVAIKLEAVRVLYLPPVAK